MRIAAFQRPPLFDDLAAVGAALLRDLRWADANGVDLALFPECWLHGHAYDRATIARRAIDLGGGELDGLLTLLHDIGATVILGAFERRGALLYNSALVIRHGEMLGRTAKAHPNEEGVTPGGDSGVIACAGWRFGIAICNDANFTEPAQRLADQGAQLICYPLNNMLRAETAAKWRGRSTANLQDRARQTRCWIASSDVVGRHNGRISHGCTAIVSPDGDIVARVDEDREGAVLFDLPGDAPART